MSPRDLLKQATNFHKEGKIQEAIDCIDRAYKEGISGEGGYSEKDFDKIVSDFDLVRKAKYLQQLGKFEESISLMNVLIEKRDNKDDPWTCLTLAQLYDHKAIILKKEKKFDEEFVERIRSYTFHGYSNYLNSQIKDNLTGDEITDKYIKIVNKDTRKIFGKKLNDRLDLMKLNSFIEKNSKKITKKIDKKQVAGLVQAIMTNQIKIDDFDIEINKLTND